MTLVEPGLQPSIAQSHDITHCPERQMRGLCDDQLYEGLGVEDPVGSCNVLCFWDWVVWLSLVHSW